jgi:hypothetical protein
LSLIAVDSDEIVAINNFLLRIACLYLHEAAVMLSESVEITYELLLFFRLPCHYVFLYLKLGTDPFHLHFIFGRVDFLHQINHEVHVVVHETEIKVRHVQSNGRKFAIFCMFDIIKLSFKLQIIF